MGVKKKQWVKDTKEKWQNLKLIIIDNLEEVANFSSQKTSEFLKAANCFCFVFWKPKWSLCVFLNNSDASQSQSTLKSSLFEFSIRDFYSTTQRSEIFKLFEANHLRKLHKNLPKNPITVLVLHLLLKIQVHWWLMSRRRICILFSRTFDYFR